jgi:peptide/nickel transport system substrate-binding protein
MLGAGTGLSKEVPMGVRTRAIRTVTAVLAASALFVPAALAQESSSTSSATASASPDQKITFTVGVTDDLNSINPLKAIDTTESFVYGLMYDGLLRLAQKDYTPEASMVDSWETSEDGLTWTFHLKSGMVWSDGEPITAEDFVWTGNFIADHDISSWSDGYRFMDSLEASDDLTIVWKTTKPTLVPGLPGYSLLLPEHIWGKMNEEQIKDFKNYPDPVVSGPFNVTEWEQGQFWRMEANPDYFGGDPYIDELVFRQYNSNESVVQALLKGAIDYTQVPTADLFNVVDAKPDDEIGTAIDSAEAFWQLSFNLADDNSSTANPAVLDKTVRGAVEHAIDRQTLIDKVVRGYATPGSTPIAPVYDYWHWEPPADVARTFNLDEANSMLDEAGYRDTDNDGIRENPGGGQPLDFRLFVASTDPDGIKAAPFIKSWLEDIGIEVSVQTMDDSKLYDYWYAYDWDMILYSWGTGPDPDFLLSSFTSNQCGYWSDTCYSNPEYDQMYKDQQTTLDRAERQQIVQTMQQTIYEDSPEIVLWYPNSFEAWRSDRWTGFLRWPEPDGVAFWGNQYSVMNVQPVGLGGSPASSTESGPATLIWVGAGALIVAAGAIALLRRRRRDDAFHA